jgi:signal transduction histidine kinase
LRGAANAEDLLQQSKALFSGQAGVALEISQQIASALGSTHVHVYCWRAPSAAHNLGSLDLTTGLTHLSDTFSDFGIASSDAKQMNLLELWQRIVHPEDFPVLKADLNAYLCREKDSFKRVVRVLACDGNEAMVRMQGFAVWSSLNNQPLLFEGTQIDITEESLENFQLGRSRRRQSQALNIIGHDLGTPLASISMSADLLLAQADRLELNLMVNRYLKNIKAASMNAREYLDSTLLYARGENENKSDGLQDVAAKDFVRSIVLKHLDRYAAASDKVQIEIDNRLVVKKVRRFALEMVMNNLISNAVKYAPLPGSKVKVTVKTAEPGEHPIFSEKAATIIEVRDEGIGIPEEFRANLFSSYARAGNVDDLPGLGLGLTIVKQGCEMLEAHLEVKSKPELETGTLFRLVLPCESIIA